MRNSSTRCAAARRKWGEQSQERDDRRRRARSPRACAARARSSARRSEQAACKRAETRVAGRAGAQRGGAAVAASCRLALSMSQPPASSKQRFDLRGSRAPALRARKALSCWVRDAIAIANWQVREPPARTSLGRRRRPCGGHGQNWRGTRLVRSPPRSRSFRKPATAPKGARARRAPVPEDDAAR